MHRRQIDLALEQPPEKPRILVADRICDRLDRLIARFEHLLRFFQTQFDLVFGTFDNPRDFAPANGFYDGASLRVTEMLVFRDIAAPPADVSAARAVA